MNRLISILLGILSLFAIAIFIIPIWLYFSTDGFPGRTFFTIIFLMASLEKIWSSLFRVPERLKAGAKKDWTTVSVGYSYLAIWYISLFDYYFRIQGAINMYVAVSGIILLLLAIVLRYWILHYLGHQWTVHVDENVDDRHLIRSGPYKYVRHPLYAESLLEAVAVALAFGSYPALIVAVFIFIPLEIHRAYFEEKYLKKIFGQEYDEYKSVTWAFFPLPFGKGRL